MPTNLSQFPLGKQPPRHDPRTLQLGAYLTEKAFALPAAPKVCGWSHKLSDFPMYLNDALGCCTIASAAHLMRVLASNVGRSREFTDKQISEAYERIDGY